MANKNFTASQVVVVKCKPLLDGWECEFDRTPICMVSHSVATKNYGGKQYEHYAVMPNGRLELIKECDY